MESYNLLVTYHGSLEGLGETEVRTRLQEAGAGLEELKRSDVEGVFLCKVSGDPKKVVADVRTICVGQPDLFHETHHWTPVERWVRTDMAEMAKAAGELGAGISPTDSWMLVLRKRKTPLHTMDLVKLLTDPIDRGRVDLKHPDKMLVVEIMGETTGMSLVAKDQLLDVNKVREDVELGRIG
ncbi:MAG TPA: THUMP domain-containing protein [Methanomassiliicoccales archaeon]|nr:THUMP domain-containing protein [Methanomassiliicoccales archaeon]